MQKKSAVNSLDLTIFGEHPQNNPHIDPPIILKNGGINGGMLPKRWRNVPEKVGGLMWGLYGEYLGERSDSKLWQLLHLGGHSF